jgi:hypothetical protein
MRLTMYFSSLLCSLLLLTACADNDNNNFTKSDTNPYAAEELWLCKPGATSNRCLELDQTTTFIYSSTSQAVLEHTPAVDPDYDCFYVYPTVDLREEPGNTEDLTDDELALRPLYNQAARFTELCSMYAPLYRQMTAGTYEVEGGYRSTDYYDIAFNDVNDAFSQYLKESGERPFVLIGHSQGSHMLLELLEQRFENDVKLRQRLISVLAIGTMGTLTQREGAIEPDSFDNIPPCTHATQTACMITYNSIVAGDLDRIADSRPCVDPTQLGGSPGTLAYDVAWENNGLPYPDYIETPWAAQPELLTANCEADGFLGIDTVAEDDRSPFIPLEVLQAVTGGTLHIADVNFGMGDLLRIVATQAENMP